MLKRCFAYIRSEVGSRGHRDALKVLQDAAVCRRVLKFLAQAGQSDGVGVHAAAAARGAGSVGPAPAPTSTSRAVTSKSLKLLTWNVAGASVSRQAPELFTPYDKLPLLKHEIVDRWAPDIFTLQECVTEEALPGFAEEYKLVGAEYVEV